LQVDFPLKFRCSYNSREYLLFTEWACDCSYISFW